MLAAGGDVNVTAKEDLTLTGSQVVAGSDVILKATAGDVSILPGEESFSASSQSRVTGVTVTLHLTGLR